MAFEIFGFKIERKSQELANANVPAFTLPESDDGSMMVSGAGAAGYSLDMDGQYKNEVELILKYRDMSQMSDCEIAIDNVVNDAIIVDDILPSVSVVLDKTDLTESIKKKVRTEFDTVLDLLNFNNYGHDIFRRWYIEGRLYYHIMIDENDPKRGIVELRSLDATKVKKVKQVKTEKTTDPRKAKVNVVPTYTYNEAGLHSRSSSGIIISGDSIAYATSGLLNPQKNAVMSYLHKAIKPLNQLRMVEDAIVIYRISRAPERRIFYIDVGNLPKLKAEQYIRDIMTRYKNRLVYDSDSGEVKDDRRHQSMLEDYWLPRREGGRGTEITTLPGGENLGQLEDVEFFQKKLYKSLHVPVSRLESDSGFSLGRESEITRDELLFSKFIQKLQTRFSHVFDEIMEKQVILKNVMTAAEWAKIKDKVHYKFEKDHYYTEFKQQETLSQRIDLARNMEDWVGQYYSKEWFRKNVLRQSDDDIEMQDSQMEKEKAEGEYEDEGDEDEM